MGTAIGRSLRAAGVALALFALIACQRTLIDAYPDTFAGVGLVLAVRDDFPVVDKTIEGGSAHSAGVEVGDRIERIDGLPTKGMSLGNVIAKIRGEVGSQVTLAIRRSSQNIIVVVPRQKMVKTGSANEAYEKAEAGARKDDGDQVLGRQK